MSSRSRSSSESCEETASSTTTADMINNSKKKLDDQASMIAYDIDGKFTYTQVPNVGFTGKTMSAVDENGQFSYISADMRPVPPGWYDLDKSKHMVPKGWYDQKK